MFCLPRTMNALELRQVMDITYGLYGWRIPEKSNSVKLHDLMKTTHWPNSGTTTLLMEFDKARSAGIHSIIISGKVTTGLISIVVDPVDLLRANIHFSCPHPFMIVDYQKQCFRIGDKLSQIGLPSF